MRDGTPIRYASLTPCALLRPLRSGSADDVSSQTKHDDENSGTRLMVVDVHDDISGHRIGERHRATTLRWRAHFPRASAHMFASTRRGRYVRSRRCGYLLRRVTPLRGHGLLLTAQRATYRRWECPRAQRRISTRWSGLPLVIAHTEASGRGVYAARRIPAGEVVHKAQPLVAHPTLENLDKVCYHCLARLPTDDPMSQEGWVPTHGGGDGGGSAGYFCGKKCAQAAWESYHAVETAAGNAVAPLVRHCVQHGLRILSSPPDSQPPSSPARSPRTSPIPCVSSTFRTASPPEIGSKNTP